MKRFVVAVLLASLFLMLPATYGQQPNDPATKEDVQKLFGLMNSRKMFDSMIDSMSKQIPSIATSAFKKQMPNATPEQVAEMETYSRTSMTKMFQSMPFDELMEAFEPAYEHRFTHGEMQELIAFYESPVGKRLVSEMPAMMAEYMQRAQPILGAWSEKLVESAKKDAEEFARKMEDAAPAAEPKGGAPSAASQKPGPVIGGKVVQMLPERDNRPPEWATAHDLPMVDSDVAAKVVLTRAEPAYPALARQAHIEGDVVLWTVVSKEGAVTIARRFSGSPLLTDAAIDAVKQWTFRHYEVNGKPTEFLTKVTVTFKLPAAQPKSDSSEKPAIGKIIGAKLDPVPMPRYSSEGAYRITSKEAEALVVLKALPEYPQEARDARIEGEVVLDLGLAADGRVEYIHYVSGNEMLAANALSAVQRSKYKPFILNGKPTRVITQVKVNFNLPKK